MWWVYVHRVVDMLLASYVTLPSSLLAQMSLSATETNKKRSYLFDAFQEFVEIYGIKKDIFHCFDCYDIILREKQQQKINHLMSNNN